MTKEEFIQATAKSFNCPAENIREYAIINPCKCDATNCKGWIIDYINVSCISGTALIEALGGFRGPELIITTKPLPPDFKITAAGGGGADGDRRMGGGGGSAVQK